VVAPPALLGSAKDYDWRELATLPWIGTPPASVHNRLLTKVFDRMGLRQNQVAQVDQESSMLAMVRTGVGLSLARESIALREAQSGNVTILAGKRLDTSLSFVSLAQRRDDPVVQLAFDAIDDVWPT
jgi:DNA-binding transcriptional LysR family regulator